MAALLAWSWSDVQTWQRIFEAHQLQQFDPQYQAGHATVLLGLIVLGAITLLDRPLAALWYVLTTYTLAYGGLADALYYWLDRRPIPAALPWLDVAHPLILVHPVTGTGLMASAAFWLASGAASWLAGRRLERG